MTDRFKFRAWNVIVERFQYFDFQELSQMNYEDIQWHILEFQACLGIKDKNNTLIYEGDVVRLNQNDYIIKYCDKCKAYECFDMNKNCLNCSGKFKWGDFIEQINLDGCTIIGNVYKLNNGVCL